MLAAVGTASAAMDPLLIDVSLNGVQVCKSSAPAGDKSKFHFSGREVRIDISMNIGESAATVITNDLSHDYVEENSAYST